MCSRRSELQSHVSLFLVSTNLLLHTSPGKRVDVHLEAAIWRRVRVVQAHITLVEDGVLEPWLFAAHTGEEANNSDTVTGKLALSDGRGVGTSVDARGRESGDKGDEVGELHV